MLLLKQAYTPPTIAVQPLPYTLHHGDCIAVMRTLPENSIDAIVTDPPAGIHFMNMAFDSDKGGRKQWIAWLSEVMREALRCLKPGGHAFVWALPRTSHWTATALEDAGFEIRDVITHLFGSGFPKSHDISKAIDRMHGAKREVAGIGQWANRGIGINGATFKHESSTMEGRDITAPATPDAIRYAGYGTALKPASEHWILCRKPLSESTIAANVLKHGTGGLNIDASRISHNDRVQCQRGGIDSMFFRDGEYAGHGREYTTQGRFPSNLLLSHTLECQHVGTHKVHVNDHAHIRYNHAGNQGYHGNVNDFEGHGYADSEGMETIEAWHCTELCPIRLLDEQSGIRKSSGGVGIHKSGKQGYHGNVNDFATINYGDEGGASRYFKCFYPLVDEYVTSCYNEENNEGVNQWQKQMHGGITANQMDDGIGNGESQEVVKSTSNLSIDGSGSNQTEQSQMDTRYTTSTTIKPITDSKTSCSLQQNGMTTITNDSERTIVSMNKELKSDGVNTKSTGNLYQTSLLEEQEPITATVNYAVLQSLETGEQKTQNTTETKQENGTKSNELKRDIPEAHTKQVSENPSSRYFATFAPTPDDYPPFYYCSKSSRKERNAGCEGLISPTFDNSEIVVIQLTHDSQTVGENQWENQGQRVTLRVDTAQYPPKVIDVSGIPQNVAIEWNTFLFGSGTTEPSLKICKFTISTMTSSIIESKTLSWLIPLLTNESIADVKLETVNGGNHVVTVDNSIQSVTIMSESSLYLPGVGSVAAKTPLTITASAGNQGVYNNIDFGTMKAGGSGKPVNGTGLPLPRGNTHPTIKPLALMRYLAAMITHENGVILDPFMGSGSTGVAAIAQGFQFVGIEQEEDYLKIADARIAHAAMEVYA